MIYTVGIIFSEDFKKVLLIKKTKPDWQKGNYNFPGGKLEETDCNYQACVKREIKEECSLDIDTWFHVGKIRNNNLKYNYTVDIFATVLLKGEGKVSSPTEEKNKWFKINKLPKNIVSNVPWLILFAKNWFEQGNHDTLSFGFFDYEGK